MKSIPQINTSKIIDSKRKNSGQLLIPKNFRKTNKTPESTDNSRKIRDKRDITHSQTLQNSVISFDPLNASVSRIFKNKDELNNYMLYKKYLCSKTQYHKIISEISEIDNKIKENNEKIEKMNNFLNKLKQNKKQKETDIVDLLSNKESLEEIYQSRMYHLRNKSQILNIKNINDQNNKNQNKKENNNIRNKNEKSEQNLNINDSIEDNNEYSQRLSTINIFEQNNFEVKLDEIKLSDKKKYEEQVIVFAQELLQKKDEGMTNKLKEKVNLAYQIFFSELNSVSEMDPETIMSNFFLRMTLFISNQSLGNYSEQFVSSFLRQLIKINYIGVEIEKILKFLNKKYKDTKLEIKEKISNLTKKNENLKNKKLSYENKKIELKKFIEENAEIVRNNEKNRINFEDEDNNNTQYNISFFSDSNFSKNKILSNRSNEKINNIKKEKVNTKTQIPKLRSCNNNTVSNIKDDSIDKKDENIKEKENSKNKILKPISVNTKNLELGKKSANVTKAKKLNMNKILNVNNYQINNTWNNTFNNIENKKGINNENISMNNNPIIDNFNNYIINCIPMDNNTSKRQEKKENNIIIRRKIINGNKSEINVNNLLINNNINIENNNIINNNILKSENIGNKKISIINRSKINNLKNNENKNIKNNKRINIPNNNLPLKNENRINFNPTKMGGASEIVHLNNNITNGMNNSITEIKYDNKTKIINKPKLNLERDDINTYRPNSKKIIMLNDSKCNSQKNINNPKKRSIINSPPQPNNGNTRKKIIVQKDIIKTVRNQNNKNMSNFLNLNKSRSPMSQEEKIDTKYFNNMKGKEKDLNKNLIRKKYLNQKNNQINYNSNTYINNKEDTKNKKIDISLVEKNNTYSKRYDNRLKLLTQGIKESFCYFKITANNDNVKFDPLDNCSSTPENFGYIDGYISIDVSKHKFKMIPKMTKNNNVFIDDLLTKDISLSDSYSNSNDEDNEKSKSYIGIELKDIVDIIITYEMKNIIRIYNAYNKYSNGQENVNINRFIYSREINDVPMEHDERIKAAFCNFFMFSLIFGNKSIPKIEFIFINYDQFNLWYNCLQYITKINNQSTPIISFKTYIPNGSPDKDKK